MENKESDVKTGSDEEEKRKTGGIKELKARG